jgi:hypothetical protein
MPQPSRTDWPLAPRGGATAGASRPNPVTNPLAPRLTERAFAEPERTGTLGAFHRAWADQRSAPGRPMRSLDRERGPRVPTSSAGA